MFRHTPFLALTYMMSKILEIHNSRIVVMSGMVAHDHGYFSTQNSGAICRTRSNTATVVFGVSVVSIETTVMVYFPILIN